MNDGARAATSSLAALSDCEEYYRVFTTNAVLNTEIRCSVDMMEMIDPRVLSKRSQVTLPAPNSYGGEIFLFLCIYWTAVCCCAKDVILEISSAAPAYVMARYPNN